MMTVRWHNFDHRAEFAEALASGIAAIVRNALDARGSAVVALSGGNTPVAAYEALAPAMFDWTRVTIVPADDRLVAVTDPLSNMAMLTRIFQPTGARLMPLASDAPDYKAAGATADAKLRAIDWPPDLVTLGMGDDGHSASILPGPDLEAALTAPDIQRAIGVMPDPLPKEAPVARVTLTKSAILSARKIIVAITGDRKNALLKQAISDGTSSSLAIGRLLADATQPTEVYWSAE